MLCATPTLMMYMFVTPSSVGRPFFALGRAPADSGANAGSWIVKYGRKSAAYGRGEQSETRAATAEEHAPASMPGSVRTKRGRNAAVQRTGGWRETRAATAEERAGECQSEGRSEVHGTRTGRNTGTPGWIHVYGHAHEQILQDRGRINFAWRGRADKLRLRTHETGAQAPSSCGSGVNWITDKTTTRRGRHDNQRFCEHDDLSQHAQICRGRAMGNNCWCFKTRKTFDGSSGASEMTSRGFTSMIPHPPSLLGTPSPEAAPRAAPARYLEHM